jgi:hypothetical protein
MRLIYALLSSNINKIVIIIMDRKRKSDINNNNKRRCLVKWNEMISPSSIRNYFLDDPLIDWLKYYSIKNLTDFPNHNNNNHQNYNNNSLSFNKFIMEQGILFEKIVFDKLKETSENSRLKIVQVSDNYQDVYSYDKYMETVNYMKQGYDIIYQGILHDYNKKLFGIPDLLVRSDKLNYIFNQNKVIKEVRSIFGNYHYVVVDIKHSTLNLNANRTFIKDMNSVMYYKGQILIYNKILGNIQHYEPSIGFILCKKLISVKKNVIISSDNYMENLAMIDYNNVDKHINIKVNNAISWVNNMRTNGHTWFLLPQPSVLELYPNMKNDYDDGYRNIKLELADKIKEITSIWWCSHKKRTIAHSKNVYSWVDKKFNAALIDIKDDHISRTINNILAINRTNSNYNYNSTNMNNNNSMNIIIKTSDLIKNDYWRYNDDSVLELYIDFETLNNNIGQIETDNNNSMNIIFMISIGWEYNNNFESETFMINQKNDDNELIMINDMWEFINNKMLELNKTDYKFIHWSNAEITFYNKFLSKHQNNNYNKFKSFDLYKLFLDNNIVVNGALNFSLKTIAKAMHKHKLINTCWDKNSSCSNGLDAMYLAYNLYKNKDNVNEDDMKDIIKYNIIDCKVMWEIFSYLRNNY